MRILLPFSRIATSVLTLLVFSGQALPARAIEPMSAKVEANRMVEFEFVTGLKRTDPFNEVTLDVIFTDPAGKDRRVPAFWAGGRVWKVRYASPVVGTHKFQSEASDARDAGLHGVTGTVEIAPYKGEHPLYTHGPLRVSKDSRSLEFADGKPFFWLGDTWWMGLCKRLSFPTEFNTLLGDRKEKGFTVVQFVAGLYPDMPAFDERGANEAGFPWEKNYTAIRPEYFDEADKRVMRIVDEGFTPCIVGAWGFHLPWLGVEKMKQHERYVYARWGALPMVWCVAGELDLPYYQAPGFPLGGEKQTAGWADVIAYCRTINAFDRMISAHPTGLGKLSSRDLFKSTPGLLDFDMLQTPHGQIEAIAPTVNSVRMSYATEPKLPVVNAEPSYEMLFDKTPAEIARMVFWVSWANGVRGYTYGANGIWQLNGKDKAYGNSPTGGTYGVTSWQTAMHLGGSTQVALAKKLLEQYPWQKFEPKPEWANWAPADGTSLEAEVGDWIWYPEGEPATDAPVASRYFRTTFDLPADAAFKRAGLRVAADDRCTVWLNGVEIASHDNWNALHSIDGVATHLKAGKNVLAIRAENLKADVVKNPAGLIAGLAVELPDGRRVTVKSSADWRASQEAPSGWETAGFDDFKWMPARKAAPLGGAPWGNVTSPGKNTAIVPYAMGIPDGVRMIYVPTPGAIEVKWLEPKVAYKASHFDPATGARVELANVPPSPAGEWRCETPKTTHDWVLILEPVR